MVKYTPTHSLPYPEAGDSVAPASRDLVNLAIAADAAIALAATAGAGVARQVDALRTDTTASIAALSAQTRQDQQAIVTMLDQIATAYDVAVQQGFSGTQQEWLESLRGEPGPEGPAGGTSVTDPQVAGMVLDDTETRAALDGSYLRAARSATAPDPTAGGVWVDGAQVIHAAVDRGPDPVVNLATNPACQTLYGTAPCDPFTIHGGTFNMRMRSLSVADPSTQAWEARLPVAATQLTASGARILGVTENSAATAGTPSQVQQLAAELGPSWETYEDKSGYMALLWDSSVYEMSGHPDRAAIPSEPSMPGRGVAWAVFKDVATGNRFVFAVTHFAPQPFGDGLRLEAARVAGARLAALGDRLACPVVLAGDINETTTGDGTVRSILASYGLVDSFTVADATTNAAANSYNGFDATMAGKMNGAHYDIVAVRGATSVPTAGVQIDWASGASPPARTPLPSDHFPVYADLLVEALPAVARQGGGGSVAASSGTTVHATVAPDGSPAIQVNSGVADGAGRWTGGTTHVDNMTRLGVTPGGAYAVSARVTVPNGYTGAGGRCLRVGIVTPSGTTYVSSPTVDVQGRTSVAFTVPGDATSCFVLLLNGSTVPGEPVVFDRFVLAAGDTESQALDVAGAYLDGDSPGCRWDGIPHDSTSTYPGPGWAALA